MRLFNSLLFLMLLSLAAGANALGLPDGPAGAGPAFAPPAGGPPPGPVGAPSPSTYPVATPIRTCEDLAKVDLDSVGGPGSHVTRTSYTKRGTAAFCVAEGKLSNTIGFRVELPVRTWTQRYLQVGCGGLCGQIGGKAPVSDGCTAMTDGGFVIGATDMGHQGRSGEFGNSAQARADFADRANHLTALAAKRLIQVYYGRKPARTYFNGCSDGGREALIEAQRYPDDFDGIIAGAPAMNFQVQNGLYHSWLARVNRDNKGHAILLADRLPILHKAVLAQCDGLDGRVDGVLADPRACHFDPAKIQCGAKGANKGDCLTEAEVAVVRKIYDGPRDPKTGTRLIVAGPQFGSELAWAGVFVPRHANEPVLSEMASLDMLRYLAFEKPQPGFKLADMTFDLATFNRLRAMHPLYDATNPDLHAFAARGGKLILWHGWSDPHISPVNTIDYHLAVHRQLGESTAQSFERLFLIPGMYHCEGGDGATYLDMLTPMLAWVETGKAPDQVLVMPEGARPKLVVASDAPPLDDDAGRKGPPGGGGRGGPPGGGMGGPPGGGMGGGGMGGGPGGGMGGPGGPGGPGGNDSGDGPVGMLANLPPPPQHKPEEEKWVPKTEAASHALPVYAYPMVTVYSGKGDPADPASYQPRRAAQADVMTRWAGEDFYRPYASPSSSVVSAQ